MDKIKMDKILNWLKANKNILLVLCGLFVLIIGVFAAATIYIPDFGAWLILIIFTFWWLCDHYKSHQNENVNDNMTTVQCEIVYEYIHENLLNATNNVLKRLGYSNVVTKSMKYSGVNRWFHKDGHIWYRYTLICPESFSISELEVQMLINQEMYNNTVYCNPIPAVYQIVRQNNCFYITATTCADKDTYYALKDMIEDQYSKKANAYASKEDVDF